jgi:small subunit ribosomal protein S17
MVQKQKKEIRKIGLEVVPPTESCTDPICPFHGTGLHLRGKVFTGKVLKSKMHKTAVIEWEWRTYNSKYERYEKKRTRIKAHNPLCINAVEGDIVKIHETRPISKTKHFVIIEKKNQKDKQ